MQPLPGRPLSQFASLSGTYPLGNADKFVSPVGTSAYSVGNVQQQSQFGLSYPAQQSQFGLSFPTATAPSPLAVAQSAVYGGLPYQSTGLADSPCAQRSQTYAVYESSFNSQGVGCPKAHMVSPQTFPSVASSAWPSSQMAPSTPQAIVAPTMAVQSCLQSGFPASCPSKFGRTVIFLDVDGVLHSTSAAMDSKFSPSCMQALARIVRTTGADIVLSSSWRTSEGAIGQVNGALSSYGLKAVIGCTAILASARENEVCQWLDEHSAEVARWIAIDDIDLAQNNVLCDSAKRMRDHFVHTNPNTGLTEADASIAVALIEKQ